MDPQDLSSSESVSDENGWSDMEPDDELNAPTRCLFCDVTFSDANFMLEHCRKVHHFDFLARCRELSLDFYGAVRLANYIRSRTRDHDNISTDIKLSDIEDDKFLRPVVEDDAFLLGLDELLEADHDAPGLTREAESSTFSVNAQLRDELNTLRSQFDSYRLTVQEALTRRWDEADTAPPAPTAEVDESRGYFASYSYNDIHETMLRDRVRTDAYRDFIYGNKHLFQGKVVLDVGCGTGILSMFCANAGAKQVFAVDQSDIIDKARENVYNNHLSHIITCIRGMVEDITLPVKEVDIIISEWMGYCLLYEAMLQSVLVARDKYLKVDGLLVPNIATLWIAPIEDVEYVSDQVDFWTDVYGFDMRAMQSGINDDVRIHQMPASALCGAAVPAIQFPLQTITVKDLSFTVDWETSLVRNTDRLDGFLIWFDIYFTGSPDEKVATRETASAWIERKEGRVAFTTGPLGEETHWKQGVLLANSKEGLRQCSSGTELGGTLQYSTPDDNQRGLSIQISWAVQDGTTYTQSWKLR